LAGHGTVATGALRRGALALDQSLELVPSGAAVRLRGLQAHGAPVQAAPPGGRLAVNLRGIDPAAAGRGTALAPSGLLAASPWWTVELAASPGGPGVASGARLVLLHGTAEVPVRVRLLEDDALAPGARGLAQLQASTPLCAPARERFVLRVASPAATVAGGRLLDPEGRRLRRRDAAILARLRALAAAEPAEAVALELRAAAGRGAPALRLARLAGVGAERAAALAEASGAVSLGGGLWIDRPAWEAAGAQLLRELERAEPEAVARRRLAERLPGVAEPVLDALLQRLAAGGAVRVERGGVRRLRVAREAVRARSEREARDGLAEALRRGGLSPVEPAGDPQVLKPALEALVRAGVAVRTWDRVQKREVVFHREAIEEARRVLRPLLAGAGVRVSEAGAALGVSRKFSVPLLEHLDAVQFTRREGDRRVLGRGASA
ncbi:MAG: SelB C-terminal domain-containing protein, partial [Caulobacteraceae bacterium]|nr:SelB C-terminal domain-containing protein [Caulobacter sp.]